MVSGAPPRTAVLLGTEQGVRAELAALLAGHGFAVSAQLADVGELDLLVIDTSLAASETRFREVTDDAFLAALEHQLLEPVAAIQAAAPQLRDGGAIVLIASRAHLGGWGGADVVAGGAALVGMMRSIALEFASRAIRINLIAPDYLGAASPTAATLAEIADTAAWLAGPGGAAVSGETILLDRGHSLRMNEAARR